LLASFARKAAQSEVEGWGFKASRFLRLGDRTESGPRKAPYPLTLIFENDNTARLGVGRPIDNAGRNVVKISIRFTCGSTSFDSSVSDRIR
jgi:hypothetical protein